MGPMGNLNRWIDYARTRVEMALRSGNRELDELEAQQRAAVEEQPWLGATDESPTFEEAKARIEWQARQAAEGNASTAQGSASNPSPPASETAGTNHPPTTPGPAPVHEPPTDLTDPADRAADAAASARLELEARQRESSARLDAIRQELGIEGPPDGTG